MSDIVVHPKFAEKAGAGDLQRHFQSRGFNAIGNVPGSRFIHLAPTWTPVLDVRPAIFRPRPQRFPR